VVLDTSVRMLLSCAATSFEMSAAARGRTMMVSRCSAMESALAGPHDDPGVPRIGKDVTSLGSGKFANVFSNPWDTWAVNGISEDAEQSVGDSECGVRASDDRTSRLDPDNRSPESVSASFPRPDAVGFPNRRKRILLIPGSIFDKLSRFILKSHLSIQTAPTFRMSGCCRELLIIC
jgi:hypothetical protein